MKSNCIKHIFSFIMGVILFLPTQIIAQKYSFSPSQTMTVEIAKDDFKVFDIYIKNISGANLDLSWTAISNTLDTSWTEYSLCDYGSCYAGIPSGTYDMATVLPNEEAFFGLNLTAKTNSGSGVVKLLLFEKGTNPANGDTVTFIVNAITGITESLVAESMLSLYPNPANSILNIALKGDIQKQHFEIYSITGEKLMEIPYGTLGVDISSLSAGVYFIRFTSNNVPVMKRFNKL